MMDVGVNETPFTLVRLMRLTQRARYQPVGHVVVRCINCTMRSGVCTSTNGEIQQLTVDGMVEIEK